MKKVSVKKLLVLLLTMVTSLALWTIPAQAAKVTRMYNYLSSNKTLLQDITRDGKKDKIRFKFTKDEYGDSIIKAQIYVNGKKAAVFTYDEYENYALTINYVYLSKNREFLQIYGNGDNDLIVKNALYSYNSKTGKLTKVLDLAKYRMMAGDVTDVTGSQITVEYTGQPMETGGLLCDFTYVYRNGKFKLKSNTVPVKSRLSVFSYNDDGYGKYFVNNQFLVANKRSFYTSTSMKKKAFTVRRGDVVTLKKIKMTSSKVYLQFQYGNKKGWQRVFRNSVYDFTRDDWENTGWFYGVAKRLAG